jgi:ribonuclease HI
MSGGSESYSATKITAPLVQQGQQELNDISTRHVVGPYWVPGHAGVRGNEISDRLARGGSVQRVIAPDPYLGVSRQNITTASVV